MMANLKSINESTHAKYAQSPQQIFQINQSMLATPIKQIQGVFDNVFEGLRVNGGVCCSVLLLGILSSFDWGGGGG